MGGVALGATDPIAAVRTKEATALGEITGVALQALLVDSSRRWRHGVPQRAPVHEDVFGFGCFHVGFTGSVTAFASASFPQLGARGLTGATIDGEVGVATEGPAQILVAEPAGFRSYVTLREVLRGRRKGEYGE